MPTFRLTPLMTAAVLAAGAATSGCGIGGIDGVELNGGVFDMLGVSASSQKRVEPKVAARPGIVLPPVADRLPQPAPEPAVAAQEWPDDDDGRRAREVADLDRRQAEFCQQAKARAKTQSKEAEPIEGPKGPCTESVLRLLNTNGQ
jgi:hypothetical protein